MARRRNPDDGWRSYGPGKYDSMVDSFLHTAGFFDEETGDVEGPGFYWLMVGDILKAAQYGAKEEGDELTQEETDELRETAAVIGSEDSQGFVSVEYFDSAKEAREKWKEIEDEVADFYEEEEGDEDDEDEG